MFTPTHWIVTISVKSAISGRSIQVMQHECRDRHDAATLLAKIRELAAELADFLPGITATGMEVCSPA